MNEMLAAASSLDRHLHDVLWSMAGDDVAAVAARLPDGTGRLLCHVRTLPPRQQPEVWVTLAAHFSQLGLTVSTWVAYRKAADTLPLAADRARVYALRAEWLAGIGHFDRGQCDLRLMRRMLRQPEPSRAPELEDATGAVVCVQASPAEFQALHAGYQSPLLRDPLRDPVLTKATFLAQDIREKGRPLDLSFVIIDLDGRPVLEVECDVQDDNYLSCRHAAIELVPLGPGGAAAIPLALRQLEALVLWSGADDIRMQSWDDTPMPVLTDWIAGFPVVRRRMRRAFIDLTRDEEEIFANFRQTSRNLVRWGQRELTFASSWDGNAAEMVRIYRDMVVEDGRGLVDEERQFTAWVEQGDLAVYGCRADDGWVAAMMVSFHADVANYGGSARKHGPVKSGLPALMYHVIQDVKRRGYRQFCLGDLNDDPSFSLKLRNIAAFKAGFTRTFRSGEWYDMALLRPNFAFRYGEELPPFTDI